MQPVQAALEEAFKQQQHQQQPWGNIDAEDAGFAGTGFTGLLLDGSLSHQDVMRPALARDAEAEADAAGSSQHRRLRSTEQHAEPGEHAVRRRRCLRRRWCPRPRRTRRRHGHLYQEGLSRDLLIFFLIAGVAVQVTNCSLRQGKRRGTEKAYKNVWLTHICLIPNLPGCPAFPLSLLYAPALYFLIWASEKCLLAFRVAVVGVSFSAIETGSLDCVIGKMVACSSMRIGTGWEDELVRLPCCAVARSGHGPGVGFCTGGDEAKDWLLYERLRW
ncbi:hypothetical protein EJB05_19838, partial [Eragrostis curvula]